MQVAIIDRVFKKAAPSVLPWDEEPHYPWGRFVCKVNITLVETSELKLARCLYELSFYLKFHKCSAAIFAYTFFSFMRYFKRKFLFSQIAEMKLNI